MKSTAFILLLFCSVTCVLSSKTKPARPPGCNSTLTIGRVGHSKFKGDSHVRSLSPWTWSWTTVTTRIPATIWEAKCSSTFCSDKFRDRINSVPIYQLLLVLHQNPEGSCYTASYQSVAVGCTCVRVQTTRN